MRFCHRHSPEPIRIRPASGRPSCTSSAVSARCYPCSPTRSPPHSTIRTRRWHCVPSDGWGPSVTDAGNELLVGAGLARGPSPWNRTCAARSAVCGGHACIRLTKATSPNCSIRSPSDASIRPDHRRSSIPRPWSGRHRIPIASSTWHSRPIRGRSASAAASPRSGFARTCRGGEGGHDPTTGTQRWATAR